MAKHRNPAHAQKKLGEGIGSGSRKKAMITMGQIKTPGQGMNDAGDALERIVSGAIPP